MYLKPKQHYVDLYDRLTIEDCRWRENFHKNWKPDKKARKKTDEKFYKSVAGVALHYDLLYATIHWHEGKESIINEWIERDTRRDELYENAEAPEGIRCLKCKSLVTPSSKILYDSHEDKVDRVLFMYDCPNECIPRRAFFHDGEEHKIKPRLCPKCEEFLNRDSERIENKKIVTTETCPSCGYVETDELELTERTKETPDPNFEKDRERFCLAGERLTRNLEEKHQLESMARLVDEWKEKDQHKDEYDAIKKLKKLTVVALENLLAPLCEKAQYVKFQLGPADMSRELVVPFIAHEANSKRADRASSHGLQKIIKKALKGTNWRLMSGGMSYRMGILSGRLCAYEREEDLLKLVKSRVDKPLRNSPDLS